MFRLTNGLLGDVSTPFCGGWKILGVVGVRSNLPFLLALFAIPPFPTLIRHVLGGGLPTVYLPSSTISFLFVFVHYTVYPWQEPGEEAKQADKNTAMDQ